MSAGSVASSLVGFGQQPSGPALPKAPTGVRGLDEVLDGGLPQGRTTLISGPAGAGKTLLGVQFLVSGVREYGEAGVLVTFEESADKVMANVASLGWDLDAMVDAGQLAMLAFHVDPTEVVQTGAFDFEPLFLMIGDAITRTGARRVVLDTVEVLFGAFHDEGIVRAELNRLMRWLEDHDVTAIVTGERGEKSLTRHGIEEYVSDCVIVLDHRVANAVSTRRLRVVKYRGSAHGTNEYPFLIGTHGFSVLPITSVSLSYPAPTERVSVGIPRLDHMLSGGVYRGSTVLVSGQAGTGKTTIGAHLIDAAARRGERCLLILFEESPDQVTRNMQSVGIDLQRWVNEGLLHIWAARPSAYGLESHLAILGSLIDEVEPQIAVLDGMAAFGKVNGSEDVAVMVPRQFDLLKSRGITTLATSVIMGEVAHEGMSSLVDTWLLLSNVEQNGERNRLLYVLKSRGMAHSNQVREFLLTDRGAELLDVYLGEEGVLTGTARFIQAEKDRQRLERKAEEADDRRRELLESIARDEAEISVVSERVDAARRQLSRLESQAMTDDSYATASREAVAVRRWADPDTTDATEEA